MTALDPLLMRCRRVFLRNYEVWINIGVHEFEKRAEQRVIGQPIDLPRHAIRERVQRAERLVVEDRLLRSRGQQGVLDVADHLGLAPRLQLDPQIEGVEQFVAHPPRAGLRRGEDDRQPGSRPAGEAQQPQQLQTDVGAGLVGVVEQ